MAEGLAVTARGLTKRYGMFEAVRGIDFDVRSTECFGFLGPNGAGKTTTMKMIASSSPPTGGELSVLGMRAWIDGRRIKSRIGVIPQDTNLDEEVTVLQNLVIYARYFGIASRVAKPRAMELLAFVALEDKRDWRIPGLSGGMKRRLLIARALMNEPELLVLDEPTTGLDPQARHLVWEKLRSLKRQGVTLLLTTHYMEEASQLCDRLVIMHEGRFLVQGSPREVISRETSPQVIEVFDPPDEAIAGLAALETVTDRTERLADRWLLYTGDGDALLGKVRSLPLDPGSVWLRGWNSRGRLPCADGKGVAGVTTAARDVQNELEPNRSLLGEIFRVPDVRPSSALRLWQRNATIYKRTYKFNVLPNFFEPFLFLLAMGLGLGAYLNRVKGVQYIDFIAPGLAATAAMYGASFEVTYNCFVKMQFGKVYDAVMSTPLTIEDIGLGELLWATTRALIYGTAFLVIAAIFGTVHSWWAILAPFGVALTGLMFAVIGLSFTAIIPIIDFYSYYWTMFLTPMFLFSGIFFPLDRLPGWVQGVAWFIPLHQAVNLMRALILNGDIAAAAVAALWIVLLTAGLLVVPLNLLRRRLVR